jgi:hypothetical protein
VCGVLVTIIKKRVYGGLVAFFLKKMGGVMRYKTYQKNILHPLQFEIYVNLPLIKYVYITYANLYWKENLLHIVSVLYYHQLILHLNHVIHVQNLWVVRKMANYGMDKFHWDWHKVRLWFCGCC